MAQGLSYMGRSHKRFQAESVPAVVQDKERICETCSLVRDPFPQGCQTLMPFT